MSFGFLFSGAVKDAIKKRLKADGNNLFNDSELQLASTKFEEAGDGKDLDQLRNEESQKAKAIEIFRRIKPSNQSEQELMKKIRDLYGIA